MAQVMTRSREPGWCREIARGYKTYLEHLLTPQQSNVDWHTDSCF